MQKLFLILLFIFATVIYADNSVMSNKSTKVDSFVYFQVTGVSESDTLSLRLSGNSKTDRILSIPHNASGLLKLQSTKNWTKVSYSGKVGWVYSQYLREVAAPSVNSVFSSGMFCLGAEPHWTLQARGNQVNFAKYDQMESYVLDGPIMQSLNDSSIWSLTAVNPQAVEKSLDVVIKRDKQCTDSMSDKSYPYSIIVPDNDVGLMSGCCR